MNIDDCFKVLELRKDATLEDVKAARIELLQVWHPDKFPANSKLWEKAQERTLKINEAFGILVKEFKLHEQKDESRGNQKKSSPASEKSDDYRKERQRFSKKQEAINEYQERRAKQTKRARRQLDFAMLSAFLAGVFGLFIGLGEWAFFLMLFILLIGALLSFLTYRKPLRKSRRDAARR
jgi:curved DNA-binding protein CbpA